MRKTKLDLFEQGIEKQKVEKTSKREMRIPPEERFEGEELHVGTEVPIHDEISRRAKRVEEEEKQLRLQKEILFYILGKLSDRLYEYKEALKELDNDVRICKEVVSKRS